jgi:D-methionine transport system substrate-binding protein
MRKKIVFILILSLSLVALGGCSNPGSNQDFVEDLTKVVVGATPVPHAEILEFIKDKMADNGFDLQIKVFTDYVQPNLATESGELDANFFQHVPYMNTFNEENGTHLVSVFPVHFEPYGWYKGRVDAIGDLPDGALIAVPNDPTNEARALQLLEAVGLITLKDGVGLLATVHDIVDNPKNLIIKEIEAAQIPRVLPDVEMAVINGNYALEAGLHIDTDSVAVEDKE